MYYAYNVYYLIYVRSMNTRMCMYSYLHVSTQYDFYIIYSVHYTEYSYINVYIYIIIYNYIYIHI